MKILGLLLFLFVCLGVSAQSSSKASAGADSRDADSHGEASRKAKSSKPQSDLLAAQVTGGADDRLTNDRFLINMNMKPDTPDSLDNANSCAYMRTYRVKRQARSSDTVAPAGYTTCVPMRHFEMRSAVETRTGSDGDK
ncbi:MAG: hypothetical protein WBV36_08345 [Terriglobales bacterium]